MKTVLITGISRGIGKALASKFISEGYNVFGTSQDGKSGASGTADNSSNLKVFQLDLSSPVSIEKCVQDIATTGTKIDILINNAGIMLDEANTHVDPELLRKTLEVNLIGTSALTEKIIPLMSKDSHVVNLSSQAGSLTDMDNIQDSHEPYHFPAYKISKAALNMYTRTLAARLHHEGTGIIVSSVHPGWVKTDMGGQEAPVLPEEAASDIFKLATSRPETGQFWYKGKKFPW